MGRTRSRPHVPGNNIPEHEASQSASKETSAPKTDEAIEEESSKDGRYRGWVFTINNWTVDDVAEITALKATAVWGIYQYEMGEMGTPHIQGAAYWKNKRTLKNIRKILTRARWAAMKGSCEDNVTYCSKSETKVSDGETWGEIPQQGKRTDLSEIAKRIVAGETVKQATVDDPDMFVKYHKGLTALREMYIKPRNIDFPPGVHWRYGFAGVGKTRWAFETFGVENVYVKDGTQWWDGYANEKCILIDDFEARWPFRDLLRLLDRYPYRGQYKGGYMTINSPFIVITCEFSPEELYGPGALDGSTNKLAQITRRLTSIDYIKKEPEKPSEPSELSEPEEHENMIEYRYWFDNQYNM